MSFIKYPKNLSTLAPLSAFLSTLLFFACGSGSTAASSDVESDEIFQQYHVWYDASRNEATAFAQFRFGGSDGTTLSLDEEAKVEVNGDSMDEKNYPRADPALWGTFYAKTFQFEHSRPNRFTFKFVNNDEESVSNSITVPSKLPRIKSVNASQTEKSRTEGLTLSIENLHSDTLRNLNCKLLDTSGHFAQRTAFMDTRSRTCTFTPGDIADLPTGSYEVQIEATWVMNSVKETGSAGGRRYLTYVSPYTNIEL